MRFEAEQDIVLSASDLSIRYPSRGASPEHLAINGVSFDLAPGEIVGIIGEAGSGKSTLARVLSADVKDPNGQKSSAEICGGEARLLGTRLRKRVTRRRLAELTFKTAYIPQDAAVRLPAEYTVREILALPVLERDAKFDRVALDRRSAGLLDAVHLPFPMLDKFPFELSSGQRQRVAIARALVLGPRVLIADEPTAGIDVQTRPGIHRLLLSLRDERGLAALVISHDFDLLRKTTDDVLALHRGSLVGFGPIDELLDDPAHPYLSALRSNEAGGTA